MEDLHNSIASPCIYQNCLAVRTEDLVQSTILFPFGGVGKKEYTKKESIQGTVTLICTSKQKVLFSKLKENVCYWNGSWKKIIHSPAFSSVKCYPSYKCQRAIHAAGECVLQIKKHSMNFRLFLIKKHPEEGWTVLSQEEASISGVIFIVIREKILLAMNVWLLDSCLLVEETCCHSPFWVPSPTHWNIFSISVPFTCDFLLKRGNF